MTEAALQIDFQPQPLGIAVVTSAPISSIANSGHYSVFQDLIDGYASSFQKVFVFSPSGDHVVQPLKNHRVTWFSGPKWLSPTNGLMWSVLKNRSPFQDIKLVRTFGPRAGVVGKALSKLTHSPQVSSSDDLVDNSWRDKSGWRATLTGLVNKLGMLKADMLAAKVDWELEYLSEADYDNDLLIGAMGMATDIFTPAAITDPDRHPVVLWAGSVVGEESASLIEEAAFETQKMIDNVEFVVVARADEADQLKENALDRDIPVTVASLDAVEPLVDLIGRAWACVTVPNREFPHGLAMLALTAGVPLISIGELDEERYSTRIVAIKEGVQLSRIARNEAIESATPTFEPKVLRQYVSPATGEVPAFLKSDQSENESDDTTSYDDPGFDLVAAALAELSPPKPDVVEEKDEGSKIMSLDDISALFAANDADPEMPSEEPVDLSGADMGQDDISALLATNDADPEVPNAVPVDLGVDVMMDQDAISALFATDDAYPEEPPAEPVDLDSDGDMDQDAISAMFTTNDPEPETTTPEPTTSDSGDMDQDAISAMFAANDPDPATETPEPESADELETESVTGAELEDDDQEVNMVQFDISNATNDDSELVNDDELLADESDEEDIDTSLIASILEGKNVDPSL